MIWKTSYLAVGGQNSKKNILGAGTKQYKVSNKEFNETMKVLNFLLQERNEQEINDFLISNSIGHQIWDQITSHDLATSFENNFNKMDTITFKNNLYLENVTVNPSETIQNFKNTNFLIVGCGGIGNFMSYAIQSFNPKSIVLIDGDKIERSNLNRQVLFTEKDIGQYKAGKLERGILSRNSQAAVKSFNEYVSGDLIDSIISNKKSEKFFVVLSGDSEQAMNETTKACVRNEIPFMSIGYLNDISVIGPLYIPKVSACPYCYNNFSIKTDNRDTEAGQQLKVINARSEAPSSFTNNALSSSLAMSDIIQFESGNLKKVKSINARVGIDNISFDKYKIETSIDPNCSYCGKG